MKAQQKKLSECASNLLAHEDLGHLRKPIVGIYKPSSIMKNSQEYMKVTKQKTLYHEEHGATLKHKCGKRIVTLSLLSFSLIFLGLLLFFGLSLFFLTWDNALENDDHYTCIYLQLNDYNSILEQSMTLYECLQRCTGICNEPRVTCMKGL